MWLRLSGRIVKRSWMNLWKNWTRLILILSLLADIVRKEFHFLILELIQLKVNYLSVYLRHPMININSFTIRQVILTTLKGPRYTVKHLQGLKGCVSLRKILTKSYRNWNHGFLKQGTQNRLLTAKWKRLTSVKTKRKVKEYEEGGTFPCYLPS